MSDKLQDILECAKGGHNLMILGQAGTGKTSLLNEIFKHLNKKGHIVQMTATTGIASSQMHRGVTIHKFCGLFDGRFTNEELLEKMITGHDVVLAAKKNILTVNCLLIDEVSMMSKQCFEQLEYIMRCTRQINRPFGGVQIILSGDFLQLKPVPSVQYGDTGQYLIESPWFPTLIPHVFLLTKVQRQRDGGFISAIHEVSHGGPLSLESEKLLSGLDRPIENIKQGERVYKLFAENYDVDLCNSENFLQIPGQVKTYQASDSGNPKKARQCPAPKKLYLKVGAPVVLITNLNDQLVNGLRGTVLVLHTNNVIVRFPNLIATVTPTNFTCYDQNAKKDVFVRVQIPLKLAFALTVHKAQGLTLPYVDVDCSKMHNPGQIGVAVSRVRSVDQLRVRNFKTSLVHKHSEPVQNFYSSLSVGYRAEYDVNYCCKRSVEFFPSVSEHDIDPDSDNDDISDDQLLRTTEDLISALEKEEQERDTREHQRETEDQERKTEKQERDSREQQREIEVQERKTDEPERENESSEEPETGREEILFDASKELKSIKYETPKTEQQEDLNACVDFLLGHECRTQTFAKGLFKELTSLLEKSMPQEGKQPKNMHTTSFYKGATLFMSSNMYTAFITELFADCKKPKAVQRRAAFSIFENVRATILSGKVEKVKETKCKIAEKSRSKPKTESVGGLATKRSIGGWCIGTLKLEKKKQVQSNLYSTSAMSFVCKVAKEVKYLDQAISNMSELEKTCAEPKTLQEVERRQNLRCGLTHINDGAFDFFRDLDLLVTSLESADNMDVYGKDLYTFICESVQKNSSLISSWLSLYDVGECDEEAMQGEIDILIDLYNEVVKKYIRMSSRQFRRQLETRLKIEKTEAHRKQIKMKSKKTQKEKEPEAKKTPKMGTQTSVPNRKSEVSSKVKFDELLVDSPETRQVTHTRLKQKLETEEYFLECFTKKQLESISKWYNVPYVGKRIKKETADILRQEIITQNQMQCDDSVSVAVPGPSSTGTVCDGGKIERPRRKRKCRQRLCSICSFECDEEQKCIWCNGCEGWFHLKCVDLEEGEILNAEYYHCPVCAD